MGEAPYQPADRRPIAVRRWRLFQGMAGWLARRTPGQLDLWEVLDARGAVRARELDESGDGRTDRVERFDASGLVAVELDTGGDGQIDRWQRWEAARLVSEDLDIDADGRADRRLTYDANGVPRLLKLDGADARQRP